MATTTQANPQADQIRANVHAMWAGVASRWAEHADSLEERGTAINDRLFELAKLAEGDRVLELACGPGGTGLAAAERVGAAGEVVLSDVAASMVDIAAGRAKERGLTNVSTRTLDIEAIDEPDASYDVVLCREGFMFAVEPERAAAEIARVLRPGGRVAIAVWGARDHNPWLGLVFDAVTAETGMTVPPPGVPGPFALGDEGRLAAALTAGRLSDVAVDAVSSPLVVASFDAWWSRTSALAGPLAMLLANLPDEKKASLVEGLRASVDQYTSADGLTIPGVALVASARASARLGQFSAHVGHDLGDRPGDGRRRLAHVLLQIARSTRHAGEAEGAGRVERDDRLRLAHLGHAPLDDRPHPVVVGSTPDAAQPAQHERPHGEQR